MHRYGGTLLAKAELQPFPFLVVYLAIIQGTLTAGQWLSFGPSECLLLNLATDTANEDRFCTGVRSGKSNPEDA